MNSSIPLDLFCKLAANAQSASGLEGFWRKVPRVPGFGCLCPREGVELMRSAPDVAETLGHESPWQSLFVWGEA